jgi:Rod binding domain-containing protein
VRSRRNWKFCKVMGPVGPSGLHTGISADAARAGVGAATPSQAFKRALDEAGAVTSGKSSKPDGKKVADAARQFEGLMIGQILKSAHGSESEGWLGAGDDDEASSTAIQVAEEYLGQAIANSGGLGIARIVIKGVDKSGAKPASSGPIAANSTPSHTDSLVRD